jgi:hypothetical protein
VCALKDFKHARHGILASDLGFILQAFLDCLRYTAAIFLDTSSAAALKNKKKSD